MLKNQWFLYFSLPETACLVVFTMKNMFLLKFIDFFLILFPELSPGSKICLPILEPGESSGNKKKKSVILSKSAFVIVKTSKNAISDSEK